MNGAREIFNRISADLMINKYADEPEDVYFSRLIYSAIGNWILCCTGDKSIVEDDAEHGVSKNHILRRCSEILNGFLEIYPQAHNWFFAEGIADCHDAVKYLRDIYAYSGYLVSAGFDTSLTLPKYRKVIIGNGLVLIRSTAKVSKMIGLGIYEFSKREKEDIKNLLNMFMIPAQRADGYVRNYIKKVNRPANYCILEGTEFFDYTSRSSLSRSWKNVYLKDMLTIYRSNYIDYGLIKSMHGQIYTCQFPKYIVEEHEVRRFMYGLKGINGVNMKAELNKFHDVAILKLHSALPLKERYLFRMLTWPVNNIKDEYNYYIPLEVVDVIKSILENLCIDVEEA